MTLDRYILRQMVARYGSVLVIVLALMVVERLPKLLDTVQLAGAKAHIIVWTVIGLLPEYLGIGLLFGLYLSIGLAIRGSALHSELDANRAMGVSTFRLMRVLTGSPARREGSSLSARTQPSRPGAEPCTRRKEANWLSCLIRDAQ